MTDVQNKTAKKREIENRDENVIEIKRIKKKLDLVIQAIERMINIMENDSKFIRFSIIILIIIFVFYLFTRKE